MTVGLALIGAGRIGKVHARAVASLAQARLVAVAPASGALDLATTYGSQVRPLDVLATSDDVDAVLICSPTSTHADLVERFARAGKAVFCEKPIDLSLERVRACLKVVADTGCRFMVGFNRRFDPQFAAARAAIEAGRIGVPELMTIVSRDPRTPPPEFIPTSGGIFRDLSIHDLDMARFMFGEELDSVYATASVLVDPDIGALGDFDSASLVLRTVSGRQCMISNSRRAAYGYDQRLEVMGSKGMVRVQNRRPVEVEVSSASGSDVPPIHDFFMSRYEEAFAAEIAAFIAFAGGARLKVPDGNDGLMALAAAEAAIKSVAERRDVRLEEVLGA